MCLRTSRGLIQHWSECAMNEQTNIYIYWTAKETQVRGLVKFSNRRQTILILITHLMKNAFNLWAESECWNCIARFSHLPQSAKRRYPSEKSVFSVACMSTLGLHTGGATSPHIIHKSLEECLRQVVPLKHQSLFQLCNCSWMSPGSYPTPNFIPNMFNNSHIWGKWRPWKNVDVVLSETRHRHPCCVRTCIVLLEEL